MEGLFQPMHLLVIFFIALLFFGPKKLPELGKGIGDGFRALRDGMKEGTTAKPAQAEVKTEVSTEAKPAEKA
jgi:sec-independent protein translocase protein TatA